MMIENQADALKNITNDLHASYGEVEISHVLQHGPGWIALYRARGQHRVALYLNTHESAEWDLVVGEEMDMETAMSIAGLGGPHN